MSGVSTIVFLLLFTQSIAFLNPLISSRGVISHCGVRRVQFILNANLGSIALVGSGPGDPDLLTMQACKLLDNAGEKDVLF